MNPGERGQPHIAGGLGLVDRLLQCGRGLGVVTGLALRSTETEDLIRLGLQKPETPRGLRCVTDVEHGVVESLLDPGEFAEHGVATNVQPWVLDRPQPMLDLMGCLDAAARAHRPR